MTTTENATWPISDESVVGCDPVVVASLAIMAGCNEAPYQDNDGAPNVGDIAFWERVKANRERIAQWVVTGLGIASQAEPIATVNGDADKITFETILKKLEGDTATGVGLILEAVLWMQRHHQETMPHYRSARLLSLLQDYEKEVEIQAASSDAWMLAYDHVFGGALGDLRDLIFSENEISDPVYHDPDTSYEDDVRAWIKAQSEAITTDYNRLIKAALMG